MLDISHKGVLLQLPAGRSTQVGMPCLVKLPILAVVSSSAPCKNPDLEPPPGTLDNLKLYDVAALSESQQPPSSPLRC